jgi:uncharacterized protein
MNKNNIDIVFYHHLDNIPCNDGFASAYVVWKYYQETNNLKKIEFIGLRHDDMIQKYENKNILFCDIALSLNDLNELIMNGNNFFIIDHHLSTMKLLDKLDNKYKYFEINHSACILTWKYFFKNEPPMLLKYIEDRDIWKNKLPNIDAFSAWFNLQNLTFEFIDSLYNDNTKLLKGIETGKIYHEHDKLLLDRLMDNIEIETIILDNNTYIVGKINSPIYKSELGNKIITNYPLIDFAYVYSIKNGKTYISLRSDDQHQDVSLIASKYFNGGGHRNASGIILNYVSSKLSSGYILDNDIYEIIKNNRIEIGYLNGKKYGCILADRYDEIIKNYLNKIKYNDIKNIEFIEAYHKQIDPVFVEKYDFVCVTNNYTSFY